MAATLNIPLTTLPVGTRRFGPANLADSDTLAVITIDRTVTGGLNAAPGTTQVVILVEQSSDGGTTWFPRASTSMAGGIFTDRGTGGTLTANDVGVTLEAGTGRQARAAVTVSGAPVAVAGSLVIS